MTSIHTLHNNDRNLSGYFFPLYKSTGEALTKVLTGEYNPAGRLPNTWPASLEQVYSNVEMIITCHAAIKNLTIIIQSLNRYAI